MDCIEVACFINVVNRRFVDHCQIKLVQKQAKRAIMMSFHGRRNYQHSIALERSRDSSVTDGVIYFSEGNKYCAAAAVRRKVVQPGVNRAELSNIFRSNVCAHVHVPTPTAGVSRQGSPHWISIFIWSYLLHPPPSLQQRSCLLSPHP